MVASVCDRRTVFGSPASQMGAEVGAYDANSRTVTVQTDHLSFWTDLSTLVWRGVRKVLGEWSGFRGTAPDCGNRSGPELHYALGSMLEPPLLVCVAGKNDSGTLKAVNNRGFFLHIVLQQGLTVRGFKHDSALNAVTANELNIYRDLVGLQIVTLPPKSEVVFDYKAVSGGPALIFKPNVAATAFAGVLSEISGLSDKAELVRKVYDCATSDRSLIKFIECLRQIILDPRIKDLKISGVTISRNLFGVLSWMLKALPLISLIENLDDGSTGDLQLDAVPRPAPSATPTTQPGKTPAPSPAPPTTETRQPSSDKATGTSDSGDTPPLPAHLPIDVNRYCRDLTGGHAVRLTDSWDGWRCTIPGSSEHTHVSMDTACQHQYPDLPNVKSVHLSEAADSWTCVAS